MYTLIDFVSTFSYLCDDELVYSATINEVYPFKFLTSMFGEETEKPTKDLRNIT